MNTWQRTSSSVDSELDSQPDCERYIVPLPKRKKYHSSSFSQASSSPPHQESGRATLRTPESEEKEQQSDLDSYPRKDCEGTQPARTTRSSGPGYHQQNTTTGHHVPRGIREGARSAFPDSPRSESPDPSPVLLSTHVKEPLNFESPPVSPSTEHYDSPTSKHNANYETSTKKLDILVDTTSQHAPRGEDPLFGYVGAELLKSLALASPFSRVGLYGGLGLSRLHPSLGLCGDEDCNHPPDDLDGTHDLNDEEEDYLRTYGQPYVPEEQKSRVSGSNKKKRKIPGVTHSSLGCDIDEEHSCGFNDDVGYEGHTEYLDHRKLAGYRTKLEYNEDGFALLPKDTPTDAKAALARLRQKEPHISRCQTNLSRRLYNLRRNHFHPHSHFVIVKPTPNKNRNPFPDVNGNIVGRPKYLLKYMQPPLILPPAPRFSMAKVSNKQPPPVKANGLKGSKAVKVALKAQKEQEKKNKQMTESLGGDTIVLPDFYDSFGFEKRKNDWLDSSKDNEFPAFNFPETQDDGFSFVHVIPVLCQKRWEAIGDQINRIKLAKKRATELQEAEKVRAENERKERAKEAKASSSNSHANENGVKSKPTSKSESVTLSSAASVPPAKSNVQPTQLPTPAASPKSTSLYSEEKTEKEKKPKKGKKKRSAHANAKNVHHRDNYVPSRVLPNPDGTSTSIHNNTTPGPSQSFISWPASEKAIQEAGKDVYGNVASRMYFGPDDWLCAFCEYELWYGQESSLLKTLQKRKGVLKVRKRAQDRAAKTTAGSAETEAQK